MKRIGNLYEKIISIENLKEADKNASKGKKWQRGVINHNNNKETNIPKLQNQLLNREFKTSKYSVFTIIDKNKERKISSLPYFPDRIIQHAVLQIISPIFIKCFIAQTYSCIPKRGIHKCLFDIKKDLKNVKNTQYCLKLDIKKFYENINNSTLKLFLRRKFKDKDLLYLLDNIIDSNDKGIVIGSYMSQWFGNFYLNRFDHWLKEIKKVKYYYRYMDDLVILHNNKVFLYELKEEIKNYLYNILDLELSNYQVFPVSSRGIDFLGYKFFHTHILLRKSIKQKMKRTISFRNLHSYKGWTKWCNARNLERKYLNKFIMNTN